MKTDILLESLALALLLTIPPLAILIVLYTQQAITPTNALAWAVLALAWTILIALAYSKRKIKLLLR